eukprot:jgi/Galph1/5457/GphlegSOOS_G4028.1
MTETQPLEPLLWETTPNNPKLTTIKKKGYPHTPESRAKISAANKGCVPWNKGKQHSRETKEKISLRLKAIMADPKVKAALRERQLGKIQSPMTRLRIRSSMTKLMHTKPPVLEGKGPIPYSFASHTVAVVNERIFAQLTHWRQRFPHVVSKRSYHTLSQLFGIETVRRNQSSVPKKTKPPKSEETRKRIAEAIRAKWREMEYRAKVVEAAKKRPGKPITEETKRRISASLRKYYELNDKSCTKQIPKQNGAKNNVLFRNRTDRSLRKQQLAELLRKQMEKLSHLNQRRNNLFAVPQTNLSSSLGHAASVSCVEMRKGKGGYERLSSKKEMKEEEREPSNVKENISSTKKSEPSTSSQGNDSSAYRRRILSYNEEGELEFERDLEVGEDSGVLTEQLKKGIATSTLEEHNPIAEAMNPELDFVEDEDDTLLMDELEEEEEEEEEFPFQDEESTSS